MNLRKWMTLFGTTILIGALGALVTGAIMQLCDPTFRNVDANGWLFNLFMMALGGLSFGAFAHMGFFAYLMLNYIARSIFKRPYLWVAFQGFVAVFVLVEIAYWTYGSKFPTATFWALPVILAAVSALVAWKKVSETSSGAWIPTMFYMIAVTAIEGMPGFQSDKWTSLVFTLVPIFICNAYQIMRLHKILGTSRSASKMTVNATN